MLMGEEAILIVNDRGMFEVFPGYYGSLVSSKHSLSIENDRLLNEIKLKNDKLKQIEEENMRLYNIIGNLVNPKMKE